MQSISFHVLVADSATARLYAPAGRRGRLEETLRLTHPASRLKTSELMTGQRGRESSSAGTQRSAMEQRTDPHEHEAAVFAREVVNAVETVRKQSGLDKLYVVAPPRLLGHLRENYSDALGRCIAAEVPKNLVNATIDEVRASLPLERTS